MNDGELSDRELLARYVAGDASAFEAIHQKYVGLVYSVCLRCVRVPQDAEDAAAACFVVLVKSASKIKAGGSLKAWLYSCALRTARKAAMLRKHRAERETEAYNMDLIEKDERWEAVDPLFALWLRSQVEESL